MIVIAIIILLVALYLYSRNKGTTNAQKAEAMGIDVNQVEEAVMPSKSVYVEAARQIGAGALESAKLAKDNAREVISEVQKDAKVQRLEALMADEELMASLKAKLAQETQEK